MLTRHIGEATYLQVTRGGVDLVSPPDTPSGKTWRYQITLPFQVAPRLAAVFCNLRECYAPGVDFEAGNDVILFDDLSRITTDRVVPLTRNHEEPNPNTTPPGAASVMVKYPARGGFVPLGAKRPDGSPHPYAGSGFAISQALAWPRNLQVSPPYDAYDYVGSETYLYFELQQLAYDGRSFRVLSAERLSIDEVLPGWIIYDGGLTNAIPDGDDLLVGMKGGQKSSETVEFVKGGTTRGGWGTGVMRWRREGKEWRPVSFVPVTGDDDSMEPSLIRDVDGSLLFCARGRRWPNNHDVQVWRSTDGGETWSKVIHVRNIVSSAPITLNQAADGTPYIAANLYEVFMHPATPRLKPPINPNLSLRGGGWTRQTLCLWPLNAARTDLEAPVVARDCLGEFGPPPAGSSWRVDHPSAMTVQLADGGWHNVLGYRLLEYAELTHATGPTLQTGAYLEEVASIGKAIPTWNF